MRAALLLRLPSKCINSKHVSQAERSMIYEGFVSVVVCWWGHEVSAYTMMLASGIT